MTQRATYQSVAAHIQDRIEAGELTIGRRLPSERQLCEQLQVSRANARDALHHLENRGLIYRLNRIGWYVSPPVFIYDPTRTHSILHEARQHQRSLETELISAKRETVSVAITRTLGLSSQTPVYKVIRRRSIDGRWALLESCYYREDAFEGLLEQDLSGSLTDLVSRHYGYRQRSLNIGISSTCLNDQQALCLQVREGSPALRLERSVCVYGQCLIVEMEHWLHDTVEMRVKGESQE
ncbi:UTRA domain-containing protein [Marinobacter sp. NFXS9]|uniref:UTRA domain-containing protein n=1 Tax=Marinobacter sp. NFXS9 TaxID=2818433 RepID=UPI0032DF82E7